MINKNNTITIGQLQAELDQYNPEAPVWISIGVKRYPINNVMTGGNGFELFLESDELETPATMGAKGGRKSKRKPVLNTPEARANRERVRRSRAKKAKENA